jgi:ATP-dependent DNA ligase
MGMRARLTRADSCGSRKPIQIGFDSESAKALRAHLAPLIRKTQPYSKRIAHRGISVEPQLLAEIEYRAKSAEGKVRHPTRQRPGGVLEGITEMKLPKC